MPIHDPNRAGEVYRPSNGMEGDLFAARFCDRCTKEDSGNGVFCQIHSDTMIYGRMNPSYPKQWVFDADGKPTCTAFEERGA